VPCITWGGITGERARIPARPNHYGPGPLPRPASFCGKMLRSLLLCARMVLRAMVLGRLRQIPLSTKSLCSILPIVRDFTGRSNEGGVPHHLRAGSRLPRPASFAKMHSRAVDSGRLGVSNR
jgi:hypothetical protein